MRNHPDAFILNKMCIICGELGDHERQVKLCMQAAKAAKWSAPLFNLALALKERKEYENAIEALDRALEIDRRAPYLVFMAILAEQVGDSNKRSECLQEALESFDPPAACSEWELHWLLAAAQMSGDNGLASSANREQSSRRRQGSVNLRSSVSHAIRVVLKKLQVDPPSLYDHLHASLNRGREVYFDVFGENPHNAPPQEAAKNARPSGMSDQSLIEKAMSAVNGDKFGRLWNGNTGDYNGDDSAADMALCCMLAFWTQRDLVRMDRLFREIGLIRDRWDQMRGNRTYGDMTVEAAIQQTAEVYRGSSDMPDKREVTEEELESARDKIGQANDARTAAAVFEVVAPLALLSPGEYADVVRELKEAVRQLDLRELKGYVSKVRKSTQSEVTGRYHQIVVNDRQLRDIGDESIRELEASNVPPTLFVRSGALCLVVQDEHGWPLIRSVNEEILTSRLAKICDFVSQTEDGTRDVLPRRNIASYILAEPWWPFPALNGITQSPTVRPDGSIAYLPGYDPETKLFYHQSLGEQAVDVPEDPTQEQVSAAVSLIDELLHDF